MHECNIIELLNRATLMTTIITFLSPSCMDTSGQRWQWLALARAIFQCCASMLASNVGSTLTHGCCTNIGSTPSGLPTLVEHQIVHVTATLAYLCCINVGNTASDLLTLVKQQIVRHANIGKTVVYIIGNTLRNGKKINIGLTLHLQPSPCRGH